MSGGSKRKMERKKQVVCIGRELRRTGFIMVVFGLVTFCAFLLPIKAWIFLLAGVLIFCGLRLNRFFR